MACFPDLINAGSVVPSTEWRPHFPAPGTLPLDGTVDIWAVSLASCTGSADLDGVLSSDELNRASRFRFTRDARRFRLRRAALRIALGHYLGLSASELTFAIGALGKPYLTAASPLRFNVAHSKDLVLMAFTTIGDVGVDVEAVDESVPEEDIVTAYFTSKESALLSRSSSTETRVRTFVRLWTRKEALFKAVGCGLLSALDSIDVSQGNVVSCHFGPGDRSSSLWTFDDLELGSDFIGAVAAQAGEWAVRQWTIPLISLQQLLPPLRLLTSIF